MMVIGLTGGMASGKSTVAKYIRGLGIAVFDADVEAKNAVAPGTVCLQKIAETFGEEYLDNGALNREKLAQLVFNNPGELQKLNAMVHGEVWARAENFIATAKNRGDKIVVLDVPLLVQCGWYKRVDRVWVVTIPYVEQIKRAMARNGMSEDMAKKRLATQISNEELHKYADVVIDNSGTMEQTFVAVEKELGKIQN